VRSRAEELRRRREILLARVNAERRMVTDEYVRIAAGLERAEGWLRLARRVTPLAAAGAIALGFIVGPSRIVRLLQAAVVPALLLRQVLGHPVGGKGTLLGAALKQFIHPR
jgi:hypothetical protein